MKKEQVKNKFIPGDVVRHDDGIPMTVDGDPYEERGRIMVPCRWFNGVDQVRSGAFEEANLHPASAYGGVLNVRVPPLPPAREINAAMAAGVASFEDRRSRAAELLNRSNLAELLYKAYGDQAGWKNFLGQPMPAWDQLPDHIRDCWSAVGAAACRLVGSAIGGR